VRSLQVVDDALITPTVADANSETFTGCVYDRAGTIVRAAQRTSRGVSWKPVDPECVDVGVARREIDGDCIYLGHYTAHYGHFLLETLARFWALESGETFDRFLFQPLLHPTPRLRSFSPAKVSLECFGVDLRRVSIVRKATRVKRLVVPASLVEINNSAHQSQGAVYRRIAECCAGAAELPHPRLYLSRRRYKRFRPGEESKGYKPFTNEDQVEQLFESLGFTNIKITFDESLVSRK
jgi:capsular polysaccharide biosynthesis protein